MCASHATSLADIRRFDQLVSYLRDQMNWPIDRGDFEDLTFDYSAEELGIDTKNAAKIEGIKSLRPLSVEQPWGVFFVRFEPKRLPVVALRRILSQVALRKRASANKKERAAWAVDDLLFISNYGEGDERHMSFAHFSQPPGGGDLPTLKVLGWDNLDTPLHLEDVADTLISKLSWPDDEKNADAWREQWRSAFTLRHQEVVRTSQDLSIRLAKLARAIRDRIGAALVIETQAGPLTTLMKAFQSTLVRDLDAAGFADMYAQTIAYGLLSARIADPEKRTADDFAAHMRTSPFLRELMETFLKVGGRRGKAGGPGIDFDELGISEVVALLDAAKMDAVLRDFGDRNRNEDPVMHFYELFLSEYNKELKIQRGVFYTPQPVVSYIVRSVHQMLQCEFGLDDGLADTSTWREVLETRSDLKLPLLTDQAGEKRTISPDEPFVQILDPATGTATFLVEIIDVIYQTLSSKWKRQHLSDVEQKVAWNEYVPKHLLPRLHAYELMMAPYAIAHMKVSLKLAETGYQFNSEERARIYLTNALEPWVRQLPIIGIAALTHEAAAVNEIKRHKRFSVVIGNPPYSEKSKNEGDWINALMERYKTTIRSEEAQIKTVSNDYIKFIRLAHYIADLSGHFVIGIITSNGFLDGRLLRDLRHSWFDSFSGVDILNLHGSGRRGDAALNDENVFDILQGVSITLARKSTASEHAKVRYAEMLGRRSHKFEMLSTRCAIRGELLKPNEPLFLFTPSAGVQTELRTWPLPEIFGTGVPKKDRNKAYAGGFKTLRTASRLVLIRRHCEIG